MTKEQLNEEVSVARNVFSVKIVIVLFQSIIVKKENRSGYCILMEYLLEN